MKVLCYGVRDVELPFFEKLNEKFGFELKCIPELLNDETVHAAEGCETVMLRGNCPADRKNLEIYKNYGVKYVLTRTVGYNHIDLDAAKELGLKVAYVPFYSPNAIGELAVTLAMMLVRHTAYTVARTQEGNFIADNFMFSPEIRNSTVGIVGLGKIGLTTAKLFTGLGARVLSYDAFPKDGVDDIVEQVSFDQLIAESDVISLHCPYSAQTGTVITAEVISKMKKGAILVNTARGELHDVKAVIAALESGQLAGFGADVLEGEASFFYKDLRNSEIENADLKKLMDLYPRVLITPHIGSYTDEAVTNMVETSYENLQEFIETGSSKNQLA